MMTYNLLLNELDQKYGEWLEMAGDQAPVVLNGILAQLLVKEREKIVYYEKRLKEIERHGASNGRC